MKTTLNCGTQILATIIQQGKLVKTVTPKDYSQASLQNFFADLNTKHPLFRLNDDAIKALNKNGKVELFAGQQTLTIKYIKKN